MSNTPENNIGVFAAYKKYSVPTSIVQHIATSNFVIHSSFRDCFSTYHLLYWNSRYLLDSIREGQLTLKDSGKVFNVIYHRCTRGQLLATPDCQIALSFREPQPEFNFARLCISFIHTIAE